MDNRFDHIDELIGKYLANEATSAERSEVEKWVQASDDNRSYFDNLRLIFERAAAVRTFQEFDTDAAWNRVKSKLRQAESRTIPLLPQEKNTFKRYWQIAASIMLLACASYLVYRLTEKPVEVQLVKTTSNMLQDTLPDGSTIFVNKETSLAYEYDRSKKTRKVKMKGEAYFNVKHEEEKPFLIESEDVIIEDIGTTFNVKAYPQSPTVEVFVESGEVAFYTKDNPGLHLQEGETGIYHRQTKSFARLLRPDSNVLSYKTRVFSFYNTDLGSAIESLNEVYEVKIKLSNPVLEKCLLNVSFKGESIDVIADIIAETLGLTVSKTDNEITLTGTGCQEEK